MRFPSLLTRWGLALVLAGSGFVAVQAHAEVQEAGEVASRFAVETLHHQSGDLDEDTRLRLDRTVRRSIVARTPPSLGR